MTRQRIGDRFEELNEWYYNLDEDDQSIFIKNIKKGYKKIIQWIDENATEIRETYISLQKKLHEWGKNSTLNQVRAKLKKYKLNPALIEAMSEAAFRSLGPYRDSAVLRNFEDHEFEEIVSKIIIDNYIERRFNSYVFCDEYLGLGDVNKTLKCYTVIMNLINQHYEQLDTLEELGEFMEQELNFTNNKIGAFLKLIITHRESIDRFMLLNKLKRIESALSD